MGNTTNTDEGNQCHTSITIFFARNCICGSCAAVTPCKSSHSGSIKAVLLRQRLYYSEGDPLQEKFKKLTETTCLTVDWKEPPMFPVSWSILCFMLN